MRTSEHSCDSLRGVKASFEAKSKGFSKPIVPRRKSLRKKHNREDASMLSSWIVRNASKSRRALLKDINKWLEHNINFLIQQTETKKQNDFTE